MQIVKTKNPKKFGDKKFFRNRKGVLMATKSSSRTNANASARINQKRRANTRRFWQVFSWILVATLAVIVFALATGWKPFTTAVVAPVISTEAPPVVPAASTDAPVIVATEEEVIPCEKIFVSMDGKNWLNEGLGFENGAQDIGKRVTLTSRSILVPTKAYNEVLSPEELKLVETTWLYVRFNACNTEAVVFSNGFEMNNTIYNGGVLLSFKGEQQIRIRNGEVILWYDNTHMAKDIIRIEDQIWQGNFDIKSTLQFRVVDDLARFLSSDILSNVLIVR